MTTFYNFALELKRSLKPFWKFETPIMLLCVCLVYLFSDKKNLKTCSVKNNNSKCTKLTIKI